MTVAELIDLLNECGPHATIMGTDKNGYFTINNIDICSDDDFNEIVVIRE